jgi:hypothetical protein
MVAAGVAIGACLAVVLVVWFLQLRTPRRVRWRPTAIDGLRAAVADDLVLQHDDGHTVWASRGFTIYRSQAGGPFERAFRVRPPLGKAWAGYLAGLRSRFGYQELVEVLPLGNERFVVFAGGGVHRVDLTAQEIERTHSLRYFGPGKGRGLMAFGVTRDSHGAIYYGEYTTEPGTHPISIWKSSDEGRSWQEAFEFPAGTVRHIHTVQFDPYDGAIWVGTGDRDEHCYVGVSHDGAATFRWIVEGSQECRTCGFAFFPDVVLWGMDADFKTNHLIRLQRDKGTINSREHLPDATYYHRKLDESHALLGLAQDVVEIWVANAEGDACRWLGWSIPPGARRGPSPAVRLGRGDSAEEAEGFVHLNPLRTIEHEAAIFRIPKSAVPHPPSSALAHPRSSERAAEGHEVRP